MEEPEFFDRARYEHVRQDVLCPRCGSLPRHRILALWFENHREELRASSILYFAPESCIMLWMRRNGVHCTTADLYERANLQLDIQDTGLPAGSWDLVVCNHVLEHVDDFRLALRELHRILRPGGSLVCSFPMDPTIELLDEDSSVRTPEDRRKRFGQHDHLRIFGMGAARFLEEAGFRVERIDGANCPAEILPVVGPADYDINLLFRCEKDCSSDEG
jgi:SAM-dependent methyltransferase